MSEKQELSELAVEWGLTEEELQEVLIEINKEQEEDPMEWSIFGNYGYGYIPGFGALHYPPPETAVKEETAIEDETAVKEETAIEEENK